MTYRLMLLGLLIAATGDGTRAQTQFALGGLGERLYAPTAATCLETIADLVAGDPRDATRHDPLRRGPRLRERG